MSDTLNLLSDLGKEVRALRLASGKTTTEIATISGRSRDVLNRLERGQDVSVGSLLSILAAIGHGLALRPTGRPTLQQMRERFSPEELDGDGEAPEGS